MRFYEFLFIGSTANVFATESLFVSLSFIIEGSLPQ